MAHTGCSSATLWAGVVCKADALVKAVCARLAETHAECKISCDSADADLPLGHNLTQLIEQYASTEDKKLFARVQIKSNLTAAKNTLLVEFGDLGGHVESEDYEPDEGDEEDEDAHLDHEHDSFRQTLAPEAVCITERHRATIRELSRILKLDLGTPAFHLETAVL